MIQVPVCKLNQRSFLFWAVDVNEQSMLYHICFYHILILYMSCHFSWLLRAVFCSVLFQKMDRLFDIMYSQLVSFYLFLLPSY